MPEYMTAIELAERLRLTPDTVKAMARDGRIPCIRLSPKVLRFDPQAVAEALRARSATPGTGGER